MGIVNTGKDLLDTLTNKAITILAIFGVLRLGVVRMLVPNIANQIYTVLSWVFQGIAYLAVFWLAIRAGVDVYNYFKNRKKPKTVVQSNPAKITIKWGQWEITFDLPDRGKIYDRTKRS